MLVHDFLDKDLGKAIPYGVYDIGENQGWVSVGIDHDTAHFATEAIYRWWKKMGSKRYRDAKALLITADGGGSNGSRCRLWKIALQDLAVRLELPIHMCHFPPGTSKWNKIEHRMFCHITQNWRGRPLVSHEVIIKLIANTATQAGLKIRQSRTGCFGKPNSDGDQSHRRKELAAINLKRDKFPRRMELLDPATTQDKNRQLIVTQLLSLGDLAVPPAICGQSSDTLQHPQSPSADGDETNPALRQPAQAGVGGRTRESGK